MGYLDSRIHTGGADANFDGSANVLSKREPLERLGETYKAPSRKIPVKETLTLLVTWRFHIIGIGKARKIISRIIFASPVPSAEALISWHFGFLMLLSQMACKGTHWNIVSRKDATNHVMVKAPAT